MTERTVHPIEAQSYAILRSRVDLTAHPPLTRAVIERVIHASADLDYATDLVTTEPALHQAWTALRNGAPIVTDVAMVASGITTRSHTRPDASPPDATDATGASRPDAPPPDAPPPDAPRPDATGASPPDAPTSYAPTSYAPASYGPDGASTDQAMIRSAGRGVICRIGDPAAAVLARERGITRSAAAVRLAAEEAGPGAVWVIGCAPTALYEVIAAGVRPALVIGLPVGFVGAAESKAALRESGLPAVSNRGEKGGSAVAAAAVNALLYQETTTGRDL